MSISIDEQLKDFAEQLEQMRNQLELKFLCAIDTGIRLSKVEGLGDAELYALKKYNAKEGSREFRNELLQLQQWINQMKKQLEEENAARS